MALSGADLDEAARLPDLIAADARRWRCDRPGCDGLPHQGWPHKHARAQQLPPTGFHEWLMQAGIGSGKTRSATQTCREWVDAATVAHRQLHVAVIGKNPLEMRNVCFEHRRSGLGVVLADLVVDSTRGLGPGETTLTLTGGHVFRGFSAEVPDNLKGYEFDKAWLDELAAYAAGTAQYLIDEVRLRLRESFDPQTIYTTTPKRRKHVVALIADVQANPRGHITRMHTEDNAANLSPTQLAEYRRRYTGTRLGRQELAGELLEDVEGALWTLTLIDEHRISDRNLVPDIPVRVVSVDPASTEAEDSDETGIIVGGRGSDGDDYILDDRSAHVAGFGAARRVWQAWRDWGCSWVIYEGSRKKGWMRDVLADTWARMQTEDDDWPGGAPPLKAIGTAETAKTLRSLTASKFDRAEPVAARYEQGHVHHVGEFPQLEAQQCEFVPESGESPDRLDALVHLVAFLRSRESARGQMPAAQTVLEHRLR